MKPITLRQPVLASPHDRSFWLQDIAAEPVTEPLKGPQDADIVMFIYREDKYEEESEKKGIAEIIIAKHRNGPVGSVNLRFFDRTARFADLELYP